MLEWMQKMSRFRSAADLALLLGRPGPRGAPFRPRRERLADAGGGRRAGALAARRRAALRGVGLARDGGLDGWATTQSLFPRLVLGWIDADFRVQISIFSIIQLLQDYHLLASKGSKISRNFAKI